jgi:Family of unknown function (DUF6188)
MTNRTDEIVAKIEGTLIHEAVRKIALGLGSILLIELDSAEGDGFPASPSARPYIRVECAWRIEDKENVLAASEDPRESMALSLNALHSQVVQEVGVSLPGFDLRISFDSGHSLLIFPVYANSQDYENWTIQTTSNEDIVSGPGRRIQILSEG